MEFRYLGTAAAEGIPALFCDCEVCRTAWSLGGRELRTRSQALINGELLFDFPADTYLHSLRDGIRLPAVKWCIITHNHNDHLYPGDFAMRGGGFAHLDPSRAPLTVIGSPEAIKQIPPNDRLRFLPLPLFTPTAFDRYTVTALPAHHAPNAVPRIHLLSDGEKTIFYCHDSGPLFDEVWDYLGEVRPHLDFVSLDCTNGTGRMTYDTHMNLPRNLAVAARLRGMGLADDRTRFCCNHFSHNGGTPLYRDFSREAERYGFLTSYDGMTLTV